VETWVDEVLWAFFSSNPFRMKTDFYPRARHRATRCLLAALLLCLGLRLPASAQPGNLVINGDFETRNQEPQGRDNITLTYNDLPNWERVRGTPDYLTSTTPNYAVNTQYNRDPAVFGPYAPFLPHGGTGCLYLASDVPGTSTHESVTQHLSGLVVNHIYQVSFYVLRRPSTPYKAKTVLTVHSAKPVPDFGQPTGYSPAPTAIILSPYVTNTNNWLLVTGTFVAQSTDPWIMLGFEYAASVYDGSLYYDDGYNGGPPIYGGPNNLGHAIDDVSIVDAGCPVPSTFSVNYVSGPGPCIGNRCYYTFTINNPVGWRYRWSQIGLYNDQSIVIGQSSTSPMVPTPTNGVAPALYCVFRDPFGNCDDVAVYVPLPGGGGLARQQGAQADEKNAAYPNPANESLTIPTGTQNAVLLNGQGRAVRQPDATGKFDVRELPSGLYNLQTRQNGKVLNQRIEVKH
jgi:hypothetical protein